MRVQCLFLGRSPEAPLGGVARLVGEPKGDGEEGGAGAGRSGGGVDAAARRMPAFVEKAAWASREWRCEAGDRFVRTFLSRPILSGPSVYAFIVGQLMSVDDTLIHSAGCVSLAHPPAIRAGWKARPSRVNMLFAAARPAAPVGRCDGGPRRAGRRPSSGVAARLGSGRLSARVAGRGGCAVVLRGASAGGQSGSVPVVARLGSGGGGGGGDARRATVATRALGRDLHSSTFQRALSALHGIGDARRGCAARVQRVLGGV